MIPESSIAVVLRALADMEGLKRDGAQVSPATRLVLEVIDAYPAAARGTLTATFMALGPAPGEALHISEALALCECVETRLAILAGFRVAA